MLFSRMSDLKNLIERLELLPHPEGGYYRECYRSDQEVSRAGVSKRSYTHIYYALESAMHSAWHRVHSDEIWNFYEGSPLELHCMSPDCSEHQSFQLGTGLEYAAVIPAGYWQAARSLGSYSLLGCSVAPGFEFTDFLLLRDHPRAAHIDQDLRALL